VSSPPAKHSAEQFIAPSDEPVRHDMVHWYDPRLMWRTGLRVATATMVGQIADYREVQAALDPIADEPPFGAFDYSQGREGRGVWVDYVSDLGDGWHPTVSVARQLARSSISAGGRDLQRGDILVMGGDQVYPDPSVEAYEERLIAPYATASNEQEPFEADLFAIPGNHDWYDGLKAFTSVFCLSRRGRDGDDGRRIGAWQTRSYFALALPHRWWMCGVDVQLADDLNPAQVDYFTQVRRNAMQQGDRIILCAPQPGWVFARTRSAAALDNYHEISDILTADGAEIHLVLTGDLHHYSRYAPHGDGPQLITAGGGGAFKHPTHKLPESVDLDRHGQPGDKFDLACAYPTKSVSRALSYKNLLFPFWNWDFSLTVGFVYAILAWLLESRQPVGAGSLGDAFIALMDGHGSIGDVISRFAVTLARSPEFALAVIVVYAGLVKFNLSDNRLVSLALGTAHAALHFLALILAYCMSLQIAARLGLDIAGIGVSIFVFIALMIVLGALFGGLVFGGYLIFALNSLGIQWTNAFSALRLTRYNNFIRLHIAADGGVHVYPMKIDKASRTLPTGSEVPSSEAELIEPPISI